ncbi:Programmed cell death protein 2 [Chytridiales sp. JEL 0842]|nr:Programmed cell death protein 2 [Chytridiales sp. JEL 0842]
MHLGFVEPFQPEDLTSIHNDQCHPEDFPHKIGGKPLWLNRKSLLKADQVTCGQCNQPMVMLLQLFTPEDEPPEAFYRVVYVFTCKNGACHKTSWKDCFKVFRSQLPELSTSYPSSENFPPLSEPKCLVCGLAGPKQCSGCHAVQYCSKEHQVLDWKLGDHKSECSVKAEAETTTGKRSEGWKEKLAKAVLFPESEIVTELEPEKSVAMKKKVKGIEELGLKITELEVGDDDRDGATKKEEDDDADVEETEVDVDKAFLKFQKRVDLEPEQVLRYARFQPNTGTETPLWAADAGKLDPIEVPACPHCSSPRTFEFQIMPQLLNYLSIDHKDPKALDWGVVVVYSCSAHCQPRREDGEVVAYVEEFVVQQGFSSDGMGNRLRGEGGGIGAPEA